MALGSAMTAERPLTVEDIWAQFGTALQGFVGRHVAQREAAEDIVADVLLRVHQHLGAVDDHERVTAWLFRIARNTITDHYRRTGRRRETLDAAPETRHARTGGRRMARRPGPRLHRVRVVRQAPGRRAARRLPPRARAHRPAGTHPSRSGARRRHLAVRDEVTRPARSTPVRRARVAVLPRPYRRTRRARRLPTARRRLRLQPRLIAPRADSSLWSQYTWA